MSRCQVCSLISEGNSFSCNVSGEQYSTSSSLNCDSSGAVYLLGCKVESLRSRRSLRLLKEVCALV